MSQPTIWYRIYIQLICHWLEYLISFLFIQFLKFVRKIVGKSLFEKLMKGSFYGQFVAGEDSVRIRPVVERNMSFGVKSILDYSVEKDISTEEARQAEIRFVSRSIIFFILYWLLIFTWEWPLIYRFALGKNPVSIACNYWPIYTIVII